MHANRQADLCTHTHTQSTRISRAVLVRHTLLMFTHADTSYVPQILIGEAGMKGGPGSRQRLNRRFVLLNLKALKKILKCHLKEGCFPELQTNGRASREETVVLM